MRNLKVILSSMVQKEDVAVMVNAGHVVVLRSLGMSGEKEEYLRIGIELTILVRRHQRQIDFLQLRIFSNALCEV